MLRSTSAALLAAALIALAGCGGTDDDTAVAPPPTAAATSEPPAPAPQPVVEPTAASSPEPAAAPDDAQVVTLTVAGGEVSGDTGRVEIPLGTDVRLTVTSDAADEVHVHGFELTEDLPAGQAVELEFTADRAGVFEVELHDARRVLTRLQVS